MELLDVKTNEVMFSYDCDSAKELVEKAIKEKIKLTSIDFFELQLDDVDFRGIDLSNSNFEESSLKGVNFTNANLTDVSFIRSDLEYTNFTDVNLKNSYFDSYSIQHVNITRFIAGEHKRLVFLYRHNNVVYAQIGCLNAKEDIALSEVEEKYSKNSEYYNLLKTSFEFEKDRYIIRF